MKKNNPSIYDRTALGHYPVRDGETVTLTGFNLNGTAITGSSQTSKTVTPSGWTKTNNAYPLTLVVNGITAINNINGNNAHGSYKPTLKNPATGDVYTDTQLASLSDAQKTAAMDNIDSKDIYQSYFYNRVPNGDNNNRLTDDIVFDVWQFNNKAAMPNSVGYIKEPVMKVNQADTDGKLVFAFVNGNDRFSMGGKVDTKEQTTYYSYQTWMRNYADFNNIAMALDDSGRTHGIAVGLDTQPSNDYGGRMSYVTSKWGAAHDKDDANFDYQNNFRFESIGLPRGVHLGTDGTALAHSTMDIERFASTSIAVAGGGTDRTDPTIYVAYYDKLNNQIRFRYGTNSRNGPSSHTRTNTAGDVPYDYFGLFSDNYGYGVDAADSTTLYPGFYAGPGNGNSGGYEGHRIFESKVDSYELIAGKNYEGVRANNGTWTWNLKDNTRNNAGAAVSIDVFAGDYSTEDIVPIIWYDSEENKLMYTARFGEKDSIYTRTSCSSDGASGKWLKPIEVFEEEYIGEECVIKIDGDKGIHIAAYDSLTSSLYYAYAPSWGNADGTTPTFTTCLVDSYNITGSQLSLDVVKEGSNWVPYISYYYSSMKKNKMAYLKDFSDGKTPDGTDPDTDTVTGKWEMTIIPSASSVSNDNTNIGFYKNANGTARAGGSQTGFNAQGASANGTVTGNGTTNPVIAYAITKTPSGYIEIAQKK